MTMPRKVGDEILDGLAATDPAAERSRRDLRRVHRAMGTRTILLHALRQLTPPRPSSTPFRVLELGAGDGSLMLRVARALAPEWPHVELTLLDRQALVDRATIAGYAAVGWTADTTVMDVLDWASASITARPHGNGTARWDLIVANLFLHHFAGAQLASLLDAVAASSDRFVACEPRRHWIALAGSHLFGAIGANAVTRTDAVLSVRAGFSGNELTALWATHGVEWRVHESAAGPFSHCFRAERIEGHPDANRL
jgi:hypothetical protein